MVRQIIKCIRCGLLKKHHAHGLCNNCDNKRRSEISQLIKCQCDDPSCTEMIRSIGPNGRKSRYKMGHNIKNTKHPKWKGGRIEIEDYWHIRIDGEYKHEHVYFYEQKNKLCMLPWGHVHHIDFNKENNMPWNLQGMTVSNHMKLHNPKKDRSNTICSICNSNETYIDKRGYEHWYDDKKGGNLCKKCWSKIYIRPKPLTPLNKAI